MRGNFLHGIQFFFEGIHLILSPGLKRYILVPIIVNALLLVAIFIGIAFYIQHHLSQMFLNYPQWLMLVLGWLFWILYGIISLLIGTLIFTMLTNLIASPFYGMLSEVVEERIEGKKERPITATAVFLIWARTFLRECRKILYYIPWLILCLVFLIFPFTWVLFPIVWWLIMSWIMAIQYSDYAADNQGRPFKEMMATIKQEPLTAFGFGGAVSLAMTIPVVNVIVPAAAVAGGTAFWLSLKRSNNIITHNHK
jgi:CysZ protein